MIPRVETACFWLILAITAGVCLRWSHYKLFWVDELLEYYSDSRPSLGAIVLGQLHAPFSLEPPAFHLLLHGMEFLVPSPELGSRILSIASLLASEACIYWLTLRLSIHRVTALAAMAMPFALSSIEYGPEARIYSLLMACMACALVSWQKAIDDKTRIAPLLGIFASIGIAALTHYYGVLLGIPLWIGETARTFQRGRIDKRIASAIAAGSAVLLLDLPFAKAMAPFREHYYNTGETSWRMVAFTYYWFQAHFIIYHFSPAKVQVRGALICLVLVYAILSSLRKNSASVTRFPLVVALCVTCLLPLLNLLVAQYSKAYFPRYSLPAIVGIAVLLPLIFDTSSRASSACEAVLLAIFVFRGFSITNYAIRSDAETQRKVIAAEALQPSVLAALASNADGHIYFQDVAKYLVYSYYAPQNLKDRFAAAYSIPCEIQYAGLASGSLFARNMGLSTRLPVMSFGTLHEMPGPHFMVLYPPPPYEANEEWMQRELQAENANIDPLGSAFGGELVKVTFHEPPRCA